MANQPHLLLIDSLNLIRRIHAAVPGEGEAALEGALNSSAHAVGRLLSRLQPSHGVCAFDGWQKSWRHLAYPEYKAGRKPMPDSLRQGMERFHDLFRYKGLTSLTYPNLEADDVICTLAAKALSAGAQVTIVSTDKGFAQLLALGSDKLLLWDHFAKMAVDTEFVRQRFGVAPPQLCDYLALTGDTTNHIRGVDGIGGKTAAQLLSDYADLEGIFANLDNLKPAQQRKLRGQWHHVEMARRLVRLRTDLELECSLRDFRVGEQTTPDIKGAAYAK